MKSISLAILTALLLVMAVAPAAAQGCDGCAFVNPLVAPLLFPIAVAATITASVAAMVTAPFAYAYAPYPYPYPYPYPHAYVPSVVVDQSAALIYAQPQQAPPAQQYWYYCEDPRGYYPYVSQCPRGWKQVVPQAPAVR